ncbi:MAG: (2Fe-2S) ferredoxin domain-containing protein [Cyanobacteria bacterium P01_D01_bin.156]
MPRDITNLQLFDFKGFIQPPHITLRSVTICPNSTAKKRHFIQVCQYRSCQRFQSIDVLTALKHYASDTLMVSASSCLGQCGSGPTVRVSPDNVWYCRVRPQDVDTIMEQHIQNGKPVKQLLHPRFHPDYGHLLDRLKAAQSDSPPSESTSD